MMNFNKLIDDAFEHMDTYELTDEEVLILNSLKEKKPNFDNIMKGDVNENIKNLQNFQKDLEDYANKINGKK